MKLLPSLRSIKISHIAEPAIIISFYVVLALILFFIVKDTAEIKKQSISTRIELEKIQKAQENLSLNFSEDLFEDHLTYVDNIRVRQELKSLELEIESLKNTQEGSTLDQINTIYNLYSEFQNKIKRNAGVKLNTSEQVANTQTWGNFLLNKEFETLESSLSADNKKLDDTYKTYLASIAPPPVPVGSGGSTSGYSYQRVETEKGTFSAYLIKVSKSSVRVKTLAAIEDDCDRDCDTKSLEQYAKENNAYAAMAGSYMCPADYAQCADKKWSFDFALYDSNDGKWLNDDALSWGETGLMTFNGSSSRFYRKTSDYDGDGVNAGISNFPSLLRSGEVVVDSGDIDSYQATKGLRGAIGTDDNNIYLVYVSGASVVDTAYVMRSLGAKDALNLDGGGTAAMYIGGRYVLGPGRPLANAILLIK